jgi:hypothetical protein
MATPWLWPCVLYVLLKKLLVEEFTRPNFDTIMANGERINRLGSEFAVMSLKTLTSSCLLTLPAALGLALVAAPAHAGVTSLSSSAYAFSIDLTIDGIAVDSGPVVAASGSSPPSYNVVNSLASFSIPGLFQSGDLGASAFSFFPPTSAGGASAQVTNLSISLGAILDITATEIFSSSTAGGTGTPTASGTTTIQDLTISGDALGGHTITANGPAPANFVLFDNPTVGLEIILNQQTPDLTKGAVGVNTDAVSFIFSGFPYGLNAISGDVDIAGSSASVAIVPEPATWAEMLAGFAVLGFLMRGRPKAEAAA